MSQTKKHNDTLAEISLLIRLHRFESAEKLINSTAQEAQSSQLLNLKGIIYQRQSLFNQAINEFKKAIKLDPSNIESSLNLIATYADVGMYTEANKLYENLTTPNKGTNSPAVFSQLAIFHYEQAIRYKDFGLNIQAISELKKALQINPKHIDSHIELAKVYFHKKQFYKAKSQLEEVIKQSPNHRDARTWLGLTFQKLGKKQSAEVEWNKLQLEYPDYKVTSLLQEISQSSNPPIHS